MPNAPATPCPTPEAARRFNTLPKLPFSVLTIAPDVSNWSYTSRKLLRTVVTLWRASCFCSSLLSADVVVALPFPTGISYLCVSGFHCIIPSAVSMVLVTSPAGCLLFLSSSIIAISSLVRVGSLRLRRYLAIIFVEVCSRISRPARLEIIFFTPRML